MKKEILFILLSTCVFNLSAQRLDPLRTADFLTQNRWVDSIMNGMSVDEKIGQLFMVQAYSNLDEKHEDFVAELITKYHVGNLIFMQGTPERPVEL